jgi:hypothetical protein
MMVKCLQLRITLSGPCTCCEKGAADYDEVDWLESRFRNPLFRKRAHPIRKWICFYAVTAVPVWLGEYVEG